MDSVGIFTAFIAGVISFLSPCILPLIPGYISFISGVSIDEMKEFSNKKTVNRIVLLNTIFFTLGFSLVFILLGASATFFGKLLLQKMAFFSRAAGVLIIIFGFHMMGVIKLNFLYKHAGVKQKKIGIKYVSSFLLGMGFAFGWSPCAGPILAGILLYASQEQTVFKGIVLLTVYSLGIAIPFIITALSVNYFLMAFDKIKKYMRAVEIAAGVLLIFLGVLIFFGKLTIIFSWFPFLSKLSL